LPKFGDVPGIIYIADSMDNGAKSARTDTIGVASYKSGYPK